MDIKYSKQKHELRDDPIMDFLLNSKEYLTNNQKGLLIVLVVIVVGIAGLLAFNMFEKSNSKKIEDAYGIAMLNYENKNMDKAIENLKIVAEKYPTSPQGLQSAYLLGGLFYDEGKFDDSKKYFEIASKESKEFIGAQALEGLAACYEAKGDTKSAITYLDKALSDNRITYRHSAIRWKMALLSKNTDKEKVRKLCNEIISDTTAIELHQGAENMIAVLDAAG